MGVGVARTEAVIPGPAEDDHHEQSDEGQEDDAENEGQRPPLGRRHDPALASQVSITGTC
jgi:hypothetical protein